MKAITQKFDALKEASLKIGVRDGTLRQWKFRKAVPGRNIVALITASRGKLKLADFTPERHDDATGA